MLRYTGDGIKAAFGTLGLREDEAERAVRAGLQILDQAARHAGRVKTTARAWPCTPMPTTPSSPPRKPRSSG